MKKLITGAVAAIAILLGFAACSGDLHDNDVQPLYVVGAGFEGATWDLDNLEVKAAQATLVETDGSVQRFELKATASTAQVKFATARSWSNDIAGSDTAEIFPIVNGDAVSLYSREANALPNTQNVVINDLTVGETYIIDINFNLISLATSIKVSGNAVVAPDIEIITSTDANGKDAAKIPMTRGGTTYTYEFIAAKTVDLYFYFYCPALNTTYTVGEDGKGLVAVDTILKDAHGNNLNADKDVVTDNSYVLDGWKKAKKQPIVKNHKYSITIVADDIPSGYNGSISYKAEEVAIFKDAVLIGQWEYNDNHDGDYAVELAEAGSYIFTAKNSSVEFKVLRDKSEDTMAWGGDVKITAGKDYNPGTAQPLTYKTTLAVDKNGFAYTVPKEEKSALNEVKYIKADGLTVGKKYTISFDLSTDTTNNADLDKFKICLAEVEPPKSLNEEVAKCGIRGSLNNSWDDVKEKNADESTSNSFVFGPFTTVNPQFKLATADWKDFEHQYTYTVSPITVENKKDATATVTLRQSGDGDDNIAVKGISEGAEYKIIIDVDNEKQSVNCTIKITKAGVEDKRSNIEKFVEDCYIKGKIASDSWDNKVYAVSPTYANGKKSVTIKYGPLPKSDAENEWLLTDDSVFYRSCKLRYVDLNGKKGTEVKLVSDAGAPGAQNNTITDATFDEDFYYIVVRVTTDKDGNIDGVFAKIEPTKDSKIPYLATLVITIPDTGNYKASTLKIVNLPKPQGDSLDIDGSLFAWDQGVPGTAKYNATTGDFEVTATGLENGSWIADQSPFKNVYPDGADTSAKLRLYDEDRWYCFKNGGSYTFNYSDRKE